MARYQSPSRSDEEWFRGINECRHSGLGMFEINLWMHIQQLSRNRLLYLTYEELTTKGERL